MNETNHQTELRTPSSILSQLKTSTNFLAHEIRRLEKQIEDEGHDDRLENLLTRCQVYLAQGKAFEEWLVTQMQELLTSSQPNSDPEIDKRKLDYLKDFNHGDIIQIISRERNCGIKEGRFEAIVVDSKNEGMIAIPRDFYDRIYDAAIAGAAWEWGIDWLLENDLDIYLIERPEELMRQIWNFLE